MEKRSFVVEKKDRKAIVVDETKVKVKGEWRILWAAIDVDRREVLGTWITDGRSVIEVYSFLKEALKQCKNRPTIYVDEGA